MEPFRQSQEDSSSPKGANCLGLRFASPNIVKTRRAMELNAISFESGELMKLKFPKRAVYSNSKWRKTCDATSLPYSRILSKWFS